MGIMKEDSARKIRPNPRHGETHAQTNVCEKRGNLSIFRLAYDFEQIVW
jgi:hypothetical protein